MNYESEVIGKGGIIARVVQSSENHFSGKQLFTFEIEYPRFILAELNTHCMLEKNSSSSRAVPVLTQCQMILDNPAIPVHFGKNQSGMVADEELEGSCVDIAEEIWSDAAYDAIMHVKRMANLGVHKQVANRLAEPFQRMKTVISGTEWNNFFWLRNHKDAQPEFQELARVMLEAKNMVTPLVIYNDEWHVPYVERERTFDGVLHYYSNGVELTKDQAIMVSVSCSAQTSYRKSDDSLEKAEQVLKRLNIGSDTEPAHASPCTHQGTPITYNMYTDTSWTEGVTHVDRNGNLWSGKYMDFIQYRKLIPNEYKPG